MKKRILSLLLATTMIIGTLTGCGNNNSSTSGNAGSSGTSNNVEGKTELTLSEYLNSGETIWFLTKGYGKDDTIKQIYVMESDGTVYYCNSDWTLGKAEQMDDKEIIAHVKKEYEEEVKKDISSKINNTYKLSDCTTAIGNYVLYLIGGDMYEYYYFGDRWISRSRNSKIKEFAIECYQECLTKSYNSTKEYYEIIEECASIYAQKSVDWCVEYLTTQYEPYLNNIQPSQYKLGLISDSTGNNTESEMLVLQDAVPLANGENGLAGKISETELTYLAPYESNEGTTNCFSIYDSWYGGYMTSNRNYFFLTRTTSPKIFKLDEVGTKNIPVDDIDSLFDKKALIEWEAGFGED